MKPLRVAWIGTPSLDGGVGGICRLFLRELVALSIELDVYATNSLAEIPELQAGFTGGKKRYFSFLYSWNWQSWYGRKRHLAFLMSFLKRLPLHGRMVQALMKEHRQNPYDVALQFSQGELFSLGHYLNEIPVILFPCVHAAGEWRWCQREEPLARRCELWWWRRIRNGYLAYRARLQRRDYPRVRGVIGLSQRFNAWVERDYKVSPKRLGVVYHPIEAVASAPESLSPTRPLRLLFVGRVSVRKGIDLLLRVLPRLLADHPDVEVTLIGAGSLWSDYEPLLQDLPTERCRWVKSLPNAQVTDEMRKSDILLIPSYYEPGGIVVGEALAAGMVVVASDEVGSAENLPPSVCCEFKAGDVTGFHKSIEEAMQNVRKQGETLRAEARQIAEQEFQPDRVAARLLEEIKRLLAE